MTFQELTVRAREIVNSYGLQTASVNVELSHWTRIGNYKPTELNFRIFVSLANSRYFAVETDDPETVLAMLAAECRKHLSLPSPVTIESFGDVPEKVEVTT